MKDEIRIIGEAALRAALPLGRDTVDVVEAAFAALQCDGVVMPPVLSMAMPGRHAEVDVKTAYLPGYDGFAVKVSPGFFDNPARGLPSLNGIMILFSSETGLVETVFLDNGYLTDLRTAAAGAVAARHLAPGEVETAGVIGTGVQARLQIRAAHMERPFRRLLVWGRDADKARNCAAELGAALQIEARAEADCARLVAASQLVVTATPSRTPLVAAEWLHPGLHITAMGADQRGKTEIAPAAIAAADLYVCDRISQCRELGELRGALASGLWSRSDPPELGAIISGTAPGRRDDAAVTICDLTGTGAQDTAIAIHARDRCHAQDAGMRLPRSVHGQDP